MSTFTRCAFHLDLRVQVIQFPRLLELVDRLAVRGFDALIMEWEASYPFEKHSTISNRYAYSREQVAHLVKYAAERSIEVIPLQQCFGHVEYVLRHERYAEFREDPFNLGQVCPTNGDKALVVFRELMEDVISLHDSQYMHIGGDETRLLGNCPDCAMVVKDKGTSYLYAEFLGKILQMIVDLGKTPMLWADIILKFPEYASILPKEAIFIDWNYGWAFDRFGDSKKLIEQGFTFWGAPAIRSNPDNYWLTCWKRHLKNFRDFIPFARESGYHGIVLTSWSTSGEYDYFRDSEFHIAEIIPRRRVYPQSGFNMLLEAFTSSITSEKVFDLSAFLEDYAVNRFELTTDARSTFSRVFSRPREQLVETPVTHKDARLARTDYNQLRTITPKYNKDEWRHLVLMARLEAHQIDFMIIEQRFQDVDFNRSEAPALLEQLKILIPEADEIDAEFAELQKDYLHSHEIHVEIQYRRYALDALFAKLQR